MSALTRKKARSPYNKYGKREHVYSAKYWTWRNQFPVSAQLRANHGKSRGGNDE